MPKPDFDPIHIDVYADNGSAVGYVVSSNREQLDNWIERMHRDPKQTDELVARLRSRYAVVAFLDSLNVDDGARAHGIGTTLWQHFLENAAQANANAILLLSDTAESNGFDLTAWYRRLGFEIVLKTASGPIMVRPIT